MTYIPGAPRDSALFRVARHNMDGGGKTVQSVTNSEPPAYQQPFLKDIAARASDQFYSGVGQNYFPQSTVVPLSGQTLQALGMQQQRALDGSPLLKAAQAGTQASLNGELSPGLKGMLDQIQGQVRPGIDAQFASAGRAGSPMHQRILSDAIADRAVPLAYQEYQGAMARAPELAMQDYFDIGQLGQVGQVYEQQAGANLQDQINRFNFQQQAPVNALQRYAALIQGGNVGGTTTTNQPIFSNPLMTAAGLGLGGIGAAGTLFGSGGIWPGGKGFNSMFGG